MWHMGDGWGWWMVMGWLWMAALWGLALYGIYALTRRRDTTPAQTAPGEPRALEVLARRYAAGELTDEQFDAVRARLAGIAQPDLTGAPPTGPSRT